MVFALIGGALGGALLYLIAAKQRSLRFVLGVVLVIASFFYVIFALANSATAQWVIIEVVGLLVFGALAWVGSKGKITWLIFGWIIHPLWDIPLHVFSAGADFTPPWYPLACLSFDWSVALLLARHARSNS